MSQFLKSVLYIFHPILTPLIATVLFFRVSSKYIPREFQFKFLTTIFIITIAIPILSFLIFRSMRWLPNVQHELARRPKYALFGYLFLLLFLLYAVIPPHQFPELYFYFIGLLASLFSVLVLSYFRQKVNLHLLGISSIFQFLLLLSIHYQTNINILIGITAIIGGLLTTSVLHKSSENNRSVWFGLVLGVLPAFFFVKYWL